MRAKGQDEETGRIGRVTHAGPDEFGDCAGHRYASRVNNTTLKSASVSSPSENGYRGQDGSEAAWQTRSCAAREHG
jgi:hypothetical protein